MSFNSLSNVYQQVEVNTCNKLQLVVMLYDGAIRFLGEARTAILTKNVRAKAVALDRALAIIGELQSTLQLEEGGDIAASSQQFVQLHERKPAAGERQDGRQAGGPRHSVAQDAEFGLDRDCPEGRTLFSRRAATDCFNSLRSGFPLGEVHRPLEVFG